MKLPGPGARSATRDVPASVPLLLHSSVPPAGSVAAKNRVSPKAVRRSGLAFVAIASWPRSWVLPFE